MALVDILEGRPPTPIEDPGYAELEAPPIDRELSSLSHFAAILGEYNTKPVGRISIEEPAPDWMNVGWIPKDGWFAPVVRVNDGLAYNVFPVEDEMLYVPGLDAWVGFMDDENRRAIHWTGVFEGTSTGKRISR
jgi:hypothetical protein